MKKLLSMVMLVCFSLSLSTTSNAMSIEKPISVELPNSCDDEYAQHYMFAEFVYYSLYAAGHHPVLVESWFSMEVSIAKSNYKVCALQN